MPGPALAELSSKVLRHSSITLFMQHHLLIANHSAAVKAFAFSTFLNLIQVLLLLGVTICKR